jgi:hypothetical protein
LTRNQGVKSIIKRLPTKILEVVSGKVFHQLGRPMFSKLKPFSSLPPNHPQIIIISNNSIPGNILIQEKGREIQKPKKVLKAFPQLSQKTNLYF